MPPQSNRATSAQYRFHGYVLDRTRWELHRGVTPIKLCRKTFDVLLFLVDHRDRVVGKDELLDALWSGQVVEEANLTQHVFLIRKALSGHEGGAKMIETVRNRGYHFIAALEPDDPPRSAPPAVSIVRSSHWSNGRVTMATLRAVGFLAVTAVWALGTVALH